AATVTAAVLLLVLRRLAAAEQRAVVAHRTVFAAALRPVRIGAGVLRLVECLGEARGVVLRGRGRGVGLGWLLRRMCGARPADGSGSHAASMIMRPPFRPGG